MEKTGRMETGCPYRKCNLQHSESSEGINSKVQINKNKVGSKSKLKKDKMWKQTKIWKGIRDKISLNIRN